jgi:hypothetical protein
MMFGVRAPEVSRDLQPGDTVDFRLGGGGHVILLLQRKLPSMPMKSRPSALDTAWWHDMQLDGGSCR